MLIKLFKLALQLLTILVFVHALASWFPSLRRSRIYWYIDWVVEPFLRPIRKVVKPVNGLDFSPLILILILTILQRALR
ncbi:MAG: YggT family protein [Aquificae bacterium]|nr:YggT family protein [Aquificota bacterium]